jgi:hypothetical protein
MRQFFQLICCGLPSSRLTLARQRQAGFGVAVVSSIHQFLIAGTAAYGAVDWFDVRTQLNHELNTSEYAGGKQDSHRSGEGAGLQLLCFAEVGQPVGGRFRWI